MPCCESCPHAIWIENKKGSACQCPVMGIFTYNSAGQAYGQALPYAEMPMKCSAYDNAVEEQAQQMLELEQMRKQEVVKRKDEMKVQQEQMRRSL